MRAVEILFIGFFSQSVFVSYGPNFFFSRFALKGPCSRFGQLSCPGLKRGGLNQNYDRVVSTNEKTGIYQSQGKLES